MKIFNEIGLTRLITLIKERFDSLSTVAFSGSYNDLKDTPSSNSNPVRATVSITSDNTSIIDIPFDVSSIESLTVYQNGLMLTPNIHYTASLEEITLVNYTANENDIFTFVSNGVIGTSLNPEASQIFFTDNTVNNYYSDCNTVQNALDKIGDDNRDINDRIDSLDSIADDISTININIENMNNDINNKVDHDNGTGGVQIGNDTVSTTGVAVGIGAFTSSGVAIGNLAITENEGTPIDAIQLGTGTNSEERSLKVYDYTLMNSDGRIPAERLPSSSLIFKNVVVDIALIEDIITTNIYGNSMSGDELINIGYTKIIPVSLGSDSNVTHEFSPVVTFNITESTNGNYAPVAITQEGNDNTVFIFCKESPENNFIIPLIECMKVNTI